MDKDQTGIVPRRQPDDVFHVETTIHLDWRDWVRTLFLLGTEEISTDLVIGTLHVLLKHQSDIEKATTELKRSR